MSGDEKSRYCSRCSRQVVNLSELTATERAALLASAKPGELCVSYYRRLSGEFVSAETPLAPDERRSVVQFGAAALAVGAAAVAVVTFATADATRAVRTETANLVARTHAEITERTTEAVRSLTDRVGLTQPQPKVMMLMGVMVCPPAPSPSAPTSAPTPAPAAPPTARTL
ncbi:MAG: hypothetical protein RLZZ15_1278 [Verrucomicrobiota bacterium]|jgi:hypothetical protein